MRLGLFALTLLAAASAHGAHGAEANAGQLAFVREDATLQVGERTVRLHGIHVPATPRTCETLVRPIRCGSRAALALAFKVRGFVYCRFLGRNEDGSSDAYCEVDCNTSPGRCREDLGAWLISQGWAVALPGAPFDYVVRERVARAHGRGVWGIQADTVTIR